jgi:GntR family transcriptional regulator
MSHFEIEIPESTVRGTDSPFEGSEKQWSGIDRKSSVPLFLQLTNTVRQYLMRKFQEGALKPGDFFITEKTFCQWFGVSTITAKRVLDDLEAEGWLTRERGRGTYIAPRRINQALDHFSHFTLDMRAQGMKPSWNDFYVGVVTPDPKVAEALHISTLEKVTRIERLRLLNDEPFLLSNCYLPQSSYPGLERQDLKSVPLYDLLAQQYNLAPVRCSETFEPVLLLNRRTVRMLKVRSGSPGMMWEHVAYSAEERPLEYARAFVRGDRCRLTANLR